MYTPALSTWFDSLPASMRSLLAMGSVGKLHLLDLAAQGFVHASRHPGLDLHSANMVLFAFGETPLSGELAAQILNTPALKPLLNEETRTLLRTVVRHWKMPDNLSYFQRIASRRDMVKIKHFLETQVSKEPENLFWREQAINVGSYDADHDWLSACMSDTFIKDLGPLHHVITSQLEMARGNWSGAEKCIAATGDTFGQGWSSLGKARTRLLAGDKDSGLSLLKDSLLHVPWQTQAALQAYDFTTGADQHRAELPGRVAVLLYSWNNAEDINDALKALYESDLGEAKIFALDNGSSDETGQVMHNWQQRFTAKRMEVISLPVNVGAAAARNWLMHLPEVRNSDWCVYLDDDAMVPRDWLSLFGAAAEQYPDAGVWGCKVVDAFQPTLLQSVDYHLMPLEPENSPQGMDLTSTTPHQVKLSNFHIQVLDSGQFNYMRPCASVTGCCHLFRTDLLHETGDFSIFLSPSQYDDLERDLRMLAGGRVGAYQGHLTVHHRKRTGRSSLVETTQEANALGNRYKMCVMHEPDEITKSTAMEQQVIIDDLSAKLKTLDETISS